MTSRSSSIRVFSRSVEVVRVLIANRGEIALRILRSCLSRGCETVAAYTRVDADLLHLRWADRTRCIGSTSYLDPSQMIATALSLGCDAIHPGYGFLSENAAFAALVEGQGLEFIGPSAEQIALMGDKAEARRVMQNLAVPVLPGSEGTLSSVDEARAVAAHVGYPVMLKAVAGGGGLAIARACDEKQLAASFERLSDEALTLFGAPGLYLEKYIDRARHIEIQVVGDGAGTVLHFGARECSLQRRNQKFLEEAPPPGIADRVIAELADTCCRALSSLRYRSAGTVEFLYTGSDFYFMEMNTRLQVEHPVTEMLTGIDLVDMQLSLAAGEPLSIRQQDIRPGGHAIECRINAEDKNFMPSPGKVTSLILPGGHGVRVDSHLYQGYRVPHNYDSLVAKIIVAGPGRPEAIARMRQALGEFELKGIESNRALHLALLNHPDVVAGRYDTGLVGRLT